MEAFIEKFRKKYRIPATDLQLLIDCMQEIHFKKKEIIVGEGEKIQTSTLSNRVFGGDII